MYIYIMAMMHMIQANKQYIAIVRQRFTTTSWKWRSINKIIIIINCDSDTKVSEHCQKDMSFVRGH